MNIYAHTSRLSSAPSFILRKGFLKRLLLFLVFFQLSFMANAQFPISEEKIEENSLYMANKAMAANFWLSPADEGAIGVVCHAFGSYYTGTNTTVADNWILQINNGADNMAWENIYFQMPVLLRFLLDDRFNVHMGEAAKNHLLQLFFNHLNTHDYLSGGLWDISGSENHNAVRKSVDYLAALALSKSDTYKNASFADGSSVDDHVTSGEAYWKSYFLSRAQKGLEVEIHSPTYSKYTLQCYYNLCDLSGVEELKKAANLYMHLYWADIAQHFMPANDIVGGAMSRVYKKYIYKKYYQYPRNLMTQFGWSYIAVSQHPGDFIGIITKYRVPEIISKIATGDKTNSFLITNKSWGEVPASQSGSDPYQIIPGPIAGSGGALRQSYVTNAYVMGTTLYDIRKEFSNIANQNRVMGVYFSNANDRILINGESDFVGSEKKGYRDVTGITGENCLITWRPSKYKTSLAIGTQIFMNTNLYSNGVSQNDWWFCEVGDAYVAMRPANQGWTWETETASGSQGGYFKLQDDDSPILIECSQKSDYTSFEDFKNDVLDNSFAFSNNTLTYTSSAGEDFTVYRNNSTAYPKINGTEVSFNPEFTYDSYHLQGISTAAPYDVKISKGDEMLEIDYLNLTETYTDNGTDPEVPEGQKQIIQEWNFTNNSLLSEQGLDFGLPAATAADNIDETGGTKDNTYTINGSNGDGEIVFNMSQTTGKFTYSITISSWSFENSGPNALWGLSLKDGNGSTIGYNRFITYQKTGYVGTAPFVNFKDPDSGESNGGHIKAGLLGNTEMSSGAKTVPVTLNYTIDLDAGTYTIWIGDSKPDEDDGTAWHARYPQHTGTIDFNRTIGGISWKWYANHNGATGNFIEIDRVVIYKGEDEVLAVPKFENLPATIYPTLNQGAFSVDLGNLSTAYLEVYNIAGVLVHSEQINNKNTLVEIPKVTNKGMYFVRLRSSGFSPSIYKIIIQ